MHTLLEGGYTLEDALEESKKVVNNVAFQSSISRIRDKIIKGDELSKAFLEESVFSEHISKWIAIGERSGHMKQVFQQLSQYYQNEIDKWITRFMGMIEPALILLVGVVVVLIVVFFITPIFSMYEQVF